MNLQRGFGCLPLAVFGLTDRIWLMAIAAFAVGAAFNGGVVIWGTLPRALARPGLEPRLRRLARVHATVDGVRRAGGGAAGLQVFLIAGVAPLVIGVVAFTAARMRTDEIVHPLDAMTTRLTLRR